jgi:hypothetical protein
MNLRLRKHVEISDFIDSNLFANMQGITLENLWYRLKRGEVHPHPVKFGQKYVYDPEAQIVIPVRPKPTGRPKGTTIANGAKRMKLKYPRNTPITRKIKKLKK